LESLIRNSYVIKKYLSKTTPTLRRLTVFTDGFGKLRYIAILDFISQGVLAPLHHIMIYILKRFGDTDFTFDQNASIERVTKAYNEGKYFYCFDLRAATDRLPIKLERGILKLLGISDNIIKA